MLALRVARQVIDQGLVKQRPAADDRAPEPTPLAGAVSVVRSPSRWYVRGLKTSSLSCVEPWMSRATAMPARPAASVPCGTTVAPGMVAAT